jgi:hypothetical protein
MPWQKGQSGNPAGRAIGTKVKLGENFLRDAFAAWTEHGKQAFETMATEEPGKFVQTIAGLLPKEFSVTTNALSAAEIAAKLAEFAAQAAAATAGPDPAHPETQRKGVTH